MTKVDMVIVGAGVVGLAVAYELARAYPERDIVVCEKNGRYGQEVSSRNSEVIHSGIYYPDDTLKASLCVHGNRLLYQFCADQQIRHQQLGKLIVATNQTDLEILEQLFQLGRSRAIPLQLLTANEVRRIEPQIRAKAAIFSSTTGIIDVEHYLQRLYRLGSDSGAMFLFESAVSQIQPFQDGYRITAGREQLETTILINAAGLYSDRLAELAGINIDHSNYRLQYCKGEYYRITKKLPINHLIYPPPEHSGLGIHITLDLAGFQKLGPSAYYVKEIDYQIDNRSLDYFFEAARTYLPALNKNDLEPDYAGVRPKLQGPCDPFRDFIITEETAKGLPGFINLIGIESPGLTASLAIAKKVTAMVTEILSS